MSKSPGANPRTLEKRQLILKNAMQEFLEQGYSAASMDRISARAGVSKATVYSHFTDKETLYCALIELMATDEQLAFSLESAPEPGTLPLGEHIRAVARLVLKPVENRGPDDDLVRFMRIIIAESGRFPQLSRTFVEKAERPEVYAVADYLAKCGVPTAEAEPLAWIIIGTLVYQMLITIVMSGADLLPMQRERLIDSLCFLAERAYQEQSKSH